MSTLTIGAIAPDFDLESVLGGRRRLADLRGKKVLLSFLRNAECAVCNLWVATTHRQAPVWRESGLEVVAVFESSVDKMRAQLAARMPTFEVLADPDGVAHDLFGSRTDPERVKAVVASGVAASALRRAAAAGFEPRMEAGANFFRLPAEILIREDGTVAAVHVAEEVTDHFDPEIVTRFARDVSLAAISRR